MHTHTHTYAHIEHIHTQTTQTYTHRPHTYTHDTETTHTYKHTCTHRTHTYTTKMRIPAFNTQGEQKGPTRETALGYTSLTLGQQPRLLFFCLRAHQPEESSVRPDSHVTRVQGRSLSGQVHKHIDLGRIHFKSRDLKSHTNLRECSCLAFL